LSAARESGADSAPAGRSLANLTPSPHQPLSLILP
jgi:hypothetical protein